MADLDALDPGFLGDLRHSREAVMFAARWLSDLGHPVVVNPTFERPSVEERHEYADGGDLAIQHRVEVKRRFSAQFTGREDFPYPTIIVDVCHTYDNARSKPWMYVILNRPMTCAAIVMGSTRRHWVRTERDDPQRGRTRAYYECPIEHVAFRSTTEEP